VSRESFARAREAPAEVWGQPAHVFFGDVKIGSACVYGSLV